ncbi:hypothetical protein IEQ34_011493 [Dendrobium chrysotoxum]|uniref:TraB domain-containing protein n=1 Tax=Dendrobium chrysotoxum TaxID=161865 RepID=A0AAV7GSF5_DENCH|nr:hypothetical protein IEQ34_011493 [Dendrobium chrysotoxum]
MGVETFQLQIGKSYEALRILELHLNTIAGDLPSADRTTAQPSTIVGPLPDHRSLSDFRSTIIGPSPGHRPPLDHRWTISRPPTYHWTNTTLPISAELLPDHHWTTAYLPITDGPLHSRRPHPHLLVIPTADLHQTSAWLSSTHHFSHHRPPTTVPPTMFQKTKRKRKRPMNGGYHSFLFTGSRTRVTSGHFFLQEQRMFRAIRLVSHKHPKSPLLNSLLLRRRRPFARGVAKSVALLASRNPSFTFNPFSTKMDHTTGAEPSSRSDAAEDYVHVSDSDLREVTSSMEYRADPEHVAASVPVDADEVIRGLEERRTGGSGEGRVEERRVLPEDLAKGVVHLECESSTEGGRCDVYLVGTAHVSQESCAEVQAVIRHLKPEVVFLELCSSRIAILTPQNLKVAERLEVFPGAEFRVAFEEAISYGARVFLGDRPVNITLRRTWGKMSIWHRAKFLYYIIFQTFFLPSPEDLNKMLKDMDDVDVLTLVIQEMSKAFPTIMETVLHERDMYMSSTLLKVASEHSSVVAVVGKGHLLGIRKNWKQPVDLKLLLQIPSRSAALSRPKIIASGVAIVGVAVAYSIHLMGKR